MNRGIRTNTIRLLKKYTAMQLDLVDISLLIGVSSPRLRVLAREECIGLNPSSTHRASSILSAKINAVQFYRDQGCCVEEIAICMNLDEEEVQHCVNFLGNIGIK